VFEATTSDKWSIENAIRTFIKKAAAVKADR
jgi:hypothetical protein